MPRHITEIELKQLLSYNPDDGLFTWIHKSLYGLYDAGDVAGSLTAVKHDRRIRINIKKKVYYAHRLAFLYMTGTIPPLVDHIDRDATNNRWNNLRAADKSINAINSKIRTDNSSGYKGVSFRSDKNRTKRWRAVVTRNNKTICIGTFMTKEEACIAYKAATEGDIS